MDMTRDDGDDWVEDRLYKGKKIYRDQEASLVRAMHVRLMMATLNATLIYTFLIMKLLMVNFSLDWL